MSKKVPKSLRLAMGIMLAMPIFLRADDNAAPKETLVYVAVRSRYDRLYDLIQLRPQLLI